MNDRNPWSIYLTLLLGCFITVEAGAFQAPAMPTIAAYFGVTEDVTALIVLLYFLGVVAFSPVFGRIADAFGRKRVLVSGLAMFAATEFLAAMAPTYIVLLVARFLQGMSVACILPVVLSYIAYLFPGDKRGMPLGMFAFAMSLGAASGAVIGGVMIDIFGWRSIYWVSGGMALLGLALVAWRTPETPVSSEPYRLDLPGALLLLISVGALLSVPTWISRYGLLTAPALGTLALGILAMAILWRVERTAVAPVLDTEILRCKAFLLPGLIYILFLVCYGGTVYTLAFFVNNRPGGSASQVGLMNTFIYISGMVAALISGKLVDRFNERSVIMAIIALMIAGLAMYSMIKLATPLWMIILVTAFLGFAQGMKGPVITKMALGAVPANRTSTGTGLFSMMRDFGNPAGVSIGLALFTSQRTRATESALVTRAREVGLEDSYLPRVRQAWEQGNLEGLPGLAGRLQDLGSDYQALTETARLEGLSTALPAVGTILIGVIILALILATRLPPTARSVASATPVR